MEKINWKQNLTEYGNLHNEDCCMNYESGCDFDVKDDDCCDNIRMVASFFKEEAIKIIEFISYDMKCKDDEQRKAVVDAYKEHFELK